MRRRAFSLAAPGNRGTTHGRQRIAAAPLQFAPVAGSSNGRTPDSGSGSQGSSPCPAASIFLQIAGMRFLRRHRTLDVGYKTTTSLVVHLPVPEHVAERVDVRQRTMAVKAKVLAGG